MNNTYKNTLKEIFKNPTPNNLDWKKMEALFVALGCRIIEGSGSRVKFEYNQVIATFHRPHPNKESKPYQIKDAKKFLEKIGIKP